MEIREMQSEFHEKDDHGLFAHNINIPYYCIKLTPEQAKLTEGLVAHIYECDGHQSFNIKDNNGEPTGERALYVAWFGKK